MFIQGKSMLRLTFNPGLALTGFRTTRPRTKHNCSITNSQKSQCLLAGRTYSVPNSNVTAVQRPSKQLQQHEFGHEKG